MEEVAVDDRDEILQRLAFQLVDRAPVAFYHGQDRMLHDSPRSRAVCGKAVSRSAAGGARGDDESRLSGGRMRRPRVRAGISRMVAP